LRANATVTFNDAEFTTLVNQILVTDDSKSDEFFVSDQGTFLGQDTPESVSSVSKNARTGILSHRTGPWPHC